MTGAVFACLSIVVLVNHGVMVVGKAMRGVRCGKVSSGYWNYLRTPN